MERQERELEGQRKMELRELENHKRLLEKKAVSQHLSVADTALIQR